jgi:hypothetical protein
MAGSSDSAPIHLSPGNRCAPFIRRISPDRWPVPDHSVNYVLSVTKWLTFPKWLRIGRYAPSTGPFRQFVNLSRSAGLGPPRRPERRGVLNGRVRSGDTASGKPALAAPGTGGCALRRPAKHKWPPEPVSASKCPTVPAGPPARQTHVAGLTPSSPLSVPQCQPDRPPNTRTRPDVDNCRPWKLFCIEGRCRIN